uniref:hypothetical protein n=1 Tax=Methylophaga lonarensis TaxID=999151 RepID=UPI003D2AC469
MNTKLKPLRKHLLLAGLVALLPATSWADAGSDAERIQKLEQQVNLLLERLSAQESQLNQQQQDISETKAATKG